MTETFTKMPCYEAANRAYDGETVYLRVHGLMDVQLTYDAGVNLLDTIAEVHGNAHMWKWLVCDKGMVIYQT